MKAIDINFNIKNTSIANALDLKYQNPYDGILTPSQVSKVIEALIIRIPTQTIWADHFQNEFFAHSYLLAAVNDFMKGEIKIQNVTGALEIFKDKNCNEIDPSIKRMIFETEITIQILISPSTSIATEIKKLVLETFANEVYTIQ